MGIVVLGVKLLEIGRDMCVGVFVGFVVYIRVYFRVYL